MKESNGCSGQLQLHGLARHATWAERVVKWEYLREMGVSRCYIALAWRAGENTKNVLGVSALSVFGIDSHGLR